MSTNLYRMESISRLHFFLRSYSSGAYSPSLSRLLDHVMLYEKGCISTKLQSMWLNTQKARGQTAAFTRLQSAKCSANVTPHSSNARWGCYMFVAGSTSTRNPIAHPSEQLTSQRVPLPMTGPHAVNAWVQSRHYACF